MTEGRESTNGGRVVIVDGNNVIGAVPDGWWRDRPVAVRRLLARLQCLHARTGDEIVLVLDHPDAARPEGDAAGVSVCYATRRGRDAADDRIRELVAAREPAGLDVVTSDRALARDVGRRARVVGASAFLARLDEAGC